MIESASLWSLVEARAASSPNALLAVDAEDRELSFAAYHDAALRAAGGLSGMGLGPGDTVSWMLPTRIESLVLVAALARLGVVQNPILPIYREREVGFIARQCRPRLLITPSVWRGFDFEAMARGIAADLGDLRTQVVDHALPEGPDSALPPPPEPATAGDAPERWLFYTSGTTSDPKGVRHTDETLWAAAKGMADALALEASDRVAFVFPLTHIGGVNWLQAALATGCTLILIESFADASTIPALRRHGVTLGAAGTVFHEAYLNAHRECEDPPLFPKIRAFPGGGAPKPPRLHTEIKREMGGAGILSGYGSTEAPIVSMSRSDDPDPKLAHTEGRAASPGVDLRVVGPDERPLEVGEEGEFRVRGPQLFLGYVDATLDAGAFDAQGYFRTGDLGRLDADGHVVVTGRLKDVIVRKGENVSAGEIEDLLGRHPAVADVAVIGLPDPTTGERCCAVVVCRNAKAPIDFEEMQRFLRERRLMVQKIPEQLEIVEAIPRNATGKISKNALRERFTR